MRAKSLLLACFLVLFLAITSSHTVSAAEKKNADALLLEAFKAEKLGGDSIKVAEKFEAVVKADPNNYYALIKLGLMKMGDPNNGETSGRQAMDATDYFLRAALARPSSPEAYLYLAQLNYRMGYITEGDRYLKMSRNLNRHIVYDDVCLTGWRYEDTGNYYGAVLDYAAQALSPESGFFRDPYLMKRLHASALLAPPPYDWAMLVTRLMLGNNSKVVIEKLRTSASEFLIHQPKVAKVYKPDFLVNMVLRKFILTALEKNVKLEDQIPDRHELPTVMYKLFFCNPDEIPPQPFSDPYVAFVKASGGTPQECQKVLSEIKNLKQKALTACGNTPNDEERARRLFVWLKRNVLKDYHAMDGISAKDVVENHKYLCLSGSILYTLLARDAKLNVDGFLMPGHAYAQMEKDKPIRIETTTAGPEGFDLKPDASAKSHEQDRALYQTAFESYGAISDPMKFIAYQFSNVAIMDRNKLVLNKYERLFRQVLKSNLHLDNMAQTEAIDWGRRYGKMVVPTENGPRSISVGSPLFERLVDAMAEKDGRFREDLIRQVDKSVEMVKTARGMSPFDFFFRNLIDGWTLQAARYEYLPAQAAMIKRERRRLKAQLQKEKLEETVPAESSTGKGGSAKDAKKTEEKTVQDQPVKDKASADTDLAKIDEEANKNWATERHYWLKGLKRLSAAVRHYPCSERLRGALKQVYVQASSQAEQRQDLAAISDLKSYTIGLLP
ncbi:MAG: hypothetical protein WBG50_16510 [Desulfomonilaceae bacterium]